MAVLFVYIKKIVFSLKDVKIIKEITRFLL